MPLAGVNFRKQTQNPQFTQIEHGIRTNANESSAVRALSQAIIRAMPIRYRPPKEHPTQTTHSTHSEKSSPRTISTHCPFGDEPARPWLAARSDRDSHGHLSGQGLLRDPVGALDFTGSRKDTPLRSSAKKRRSGAVPSGEAAPFPLPTHRTVRADLPRAALRPSRVRRCPQRIASPAPREFHRSASPGTAEVGRVPRPATCAVLAVQPRAKSATAALRHNLSPSPEQVSDLPPRLL
jgi:hypothetical protein